MGGGSDSRIPSILKSNLPADVELLVRTYDFDPEVAQAQISFWVEEFKPDLVIGESLGALHALRIENLPKLLVSPSLGAARWLRVFGYLSFIPGITPLLDWLYRPREGDRQKLHFTWRILRKYRLHHNLAVNTNNINIHAFFGKRDHYLKWGVVSIKKYRDLYGDALTMYDGTHFMEEEYVLSLLMPSILFVLQKH